MCAVGTPTCLRLRILPFITKAKMVIAMIISITVGEMAKPSLLYSLILAIMEKIVLGLAFLRSCVLLAARLVLPSKG
jgi:hypothetical protein